MGAEVCAVCKAEIPEETPDYILPVSNLEPEPSPPAASQGTSATAVEENGAEKGQPRKSRVKAWPLIVLILLVVGGTVLALIVSDGTPSETAEQTRTASGTNSQSAADTRQVEPPAVSNTEQTRPDSMTEGTPEETEIHLPDGWRSETRRVRVVTPQGEMSKEITYYTNSIGMEFVKIPAGEFMIGSPAGEEGHEEDERQHRVKITGPLYMGVTEVTQEQYEAIMGNNPSEVKGAQHPVEKVSWHDAQAFCKKLSEKLGITVRLPSEAEWEVACRAGTTARYCSGDRDVDLGVVAWYWSNSGNKTHPVGQKAPNAWGLYDMHGNVWEWCQSLYKAYPYDAGDGRESLRADGARAWRSGSCKLGPLSSRSAARYWGMPTYAFNDSGFRVVTEANLPVSTEAANSSAGNPVRQRNARFTISGTGYRIGRFENGARAFDHRDYVWREIPEPFEGRRFTRTNGRENASMRLDVITPGVAHVATSTGHTKALTEAGWEKTDHVFHYTDTSQSSMVILEKQVREGESLNVIQSGSSVTIVLLPP